MSDYNSSSVSSSYDYCDPCDTCEACDYTCQGCDYCDSCQACDYCDSPTSSSSSSSSSGEPASSSSSTSSSSSLASSSSSSSSSSHSSCSSSSSSYSSSSSSSGSSSSSSSGGGGGGIGRPPRRPGCECGCNEYSDTPVHYHRGEIRLMTNEVSSNGFGLIWGHARAYSNRLPDNLDFGNGYNWLVTQWPHIEQETASRLCIEFNPDRTYWFETSGSGFQGLYGVEASLTYDDLTDVYTLTFHNGEAWRFGGFAGIALPPGQFQLARTAGGQETAVVAYTASGRIAEVRRSTSGATEAFTYTYATGTDGVERLQEVALRRQPEGNDWEDVVRVAYAYYDGATPHGSLGDLKLATRRVYDAGTWIDSETRYYRYYKSGDANGFEHGLKYALEPQSYAQLLADGHTPDTVADATLATYADYYFEYDADHRVTREVTHGAAAYTFHRTDRPSPYPAGINEWRLKTTYGRPDGSQLVLYTNELGQPIV